MPFPCLIDKIHQDSYQLCDQFPVENLIDRDYEYVMSMDEDGWLVGGGYKSFDYSGKMPYIDSSHTELLRIGSVDPEYGYVSFDSLYVSWSVVSMPRSNRLFFVPLKYLFIYLLLQRNIDWSGVLRTQPTVLPTL